MPRGNDPTALEDLRRQYGEHENAEALIRSQAATRSPALMAAQMKPIAQEATDNLDLNSIEPERGGVVLSASVRGNAIVYVAEDETGRTYKGLVPLEGYREPAGEARMAEVRAANLAAVDVTERARSVRADIEQQVAEFRQKLQEEASAEFQRFAEERQQQATQEAEQAAQEAESGGGETGPGTEASAGEQPQAPQGEQSGPKRASAPGAPSEEEPEGKPKQRGR